MPSRLCPYAYITSIDVGLDVCPEQRLVVFLGHKFNRFVDAEMLYQWVIVITRDKSQYLECEVSLAYPCIA